VSVSRRNEDNDGNNIWVMLISLYMNGCNVMYSNECINV